MVCYVFSFKNTVDLQALVSMNHKVSSSQPFVLQLSSFFPFCGLTYLGVITGSVVDIISRTVVGGKSLESLLFLPMYYMVVHSICYPILDLDVSFLF